MTKKIIITLAIILCAIFATTYSFATNEIKNGVMDAANDVRNVVGDVENGVENVAKDAAGAIREGTNDVENAGENMTGDVMNQNTNGTTTSNNDNMNNDGYSATRTATDVTGGMSSTMWTWIILAIVGVAIVALVWFYAMQKNNSHENY